MKKNKIENLIAVLALVGVLVLFAGFLFGNNNVTAIVLSVLVTAAFAGIIFLYQHFAWFSQKKAAIVSGCMAVVCALSLFSVVATDALASASGALPSGLSVSGTDIFEWKFSETSISVTATPSSSEGDCGKTNYTAQSEEITLTSESEAFLVVGVEKNGNGAVMLNGTEVSSGTSQNFELAAGDTLKVSVSSGGNANESTTLTLSIKYTLKGQSVTLAFQPVDGVSYKVNGTAVSNEAVDVTGDPAVGFTVTSDSANYILTGASLEDAEGNTSAITTINGVLYPSAGGKVTPIFAYDEDADGVAPFKVGSKTYWDWASAQAAAGNSGTIVLNDDYTLPAGDYTIPSGVTLLIPFDAANTLYTTTPGEYGTTTVNPTKYRELTMATGANITVNGAISLSAKVRTGQASAYAGGPCGPTSFIKMNSGSNITLNSGGKLYAWGYVYGSGTVTAKSGSAVYECFQFMDFRGGSKTTAMKNEVFPLSQYYVQNVEVPMTIETGATVKTAACFTVSIIGTQQPEIGFMAQNSALFKLTSGTAVKRYDGTTDRLIIEINGNVSVSPISMKVSISSINSDDYIMPINGNITLIIKQGSTVTISQDTAFLPGSEIIIEEGATCALGSGTRVFVYDADQWGTFCASANKTFIPVQYSPSRTYTRTDADLKDAFIQVDGKVDASLGYIYTTADGANIHSTGTGEVLVNPGTETSTYQMVQEGSPEYVEIPITVAKFKNADGTYKETTETANYVYENGFWVVKKCDVCTPNANAPATCTTPQLCTVCGSVCAEALGHEFGATTYSPTKEEFKIDTHTKCTATRTCTRDGCGLTEIAEADITITEIPATCLSGAYYTVAANFMAEWAENQEYANVSVEGSEALGHQPAYNGSEPIYIEYTAPDCTVDGYAKYVCSFCKQEVEETIAADPKYGHSQVINKDETGHWFTCSYETCDYRYSEDHVPGAAATCTTDQICTVCGYVLTAAHHTEEEIPAVGATCTTTGATAGVKCSVCKEVLTAPTTIAALGHTEVVDAAVAATCGEAGLTEGKHCSVCNEVLVAQNEVAALGHTEVIDEAVAATCTATGLTEGKHCSVCNEVLVAQTVVAALGHTEVVNAAKAPTCTATGLTEGKHCSVCNEVLVAQETVDALGHTEETVTGKSATCTETGLTDGVKCSVCGEVLTAQQVVDALGHDIITDAAVAPTCTETGLTEGSHCSRCNDATTAQQVVDALGHDMQETAAAVAPTCTEIGSTAVYTCANGCGKTEGGDEVAAKGHKEVTDIRVNPTCTETGLTVGSHCDICGEITIAQEVLPALGHTNGETVVEDNVDATCSANGSYNNVVYCAVCNAEVSRTTVTVDALGHTEQIVPGKDANCTDTGLTEGSKCSVCGETIIAQNTIPALGHTNGETVVENNKAPTCTVNGSYDNVIYCTVCKAEVSRATVTVNALGHAYDSGVQTTAPTCTSTGVKTYTCSTCGGTKTEAITALGHTVVVDEAVAPICTATGLTEGSHCGVCGEVIVKQTVVDALGHTAVTDEAKAPTCTATGLTEGSHCSVCGEIFIAQEVVSALGHTDETVPGKAASCLDAGLTDGSKCSVCGEITKAQEEIPAKGHTETTVAGKAATCTETGLTEGTICSACDAVIKAQEVIDALGHEEAILPGKDATCSETGLTEGVQCSVCEEILTAQKVIETLSHKEVIVPGKVATCTETGLTEGKACSVCNAVIKAQEVINALGHTPETIPAEDKTCDSNGWTAGSKCSVCDEILAAPVEIPASHNWNNGICGDCDEACSHDFESADDHDCGICGLGCDHDFDDKVTPPSCTEAGFTTHTCSVCGYSYVSDETPAAHKWVSATCKEPEHCSVCNETRGELAAHIPGEPQREDTVAPTCTANGQYDNVTYCTECGTETNRIYGGEIPALTHDWSGWETTTEASCMQEGEETRTCLRDGCGAKETNTLPKAAHSYVDTVTDPTCNGQGFTTHDCSNCDYSYVDSYVDALGHDEIEQAAKTPTCTEKGWDAYVICSRCDYSTLAKKPATGHDWADATYAWTGIDDNDTVTCTATRLCNHDNSHKEEVRGSVDSTVTQEPDCVNVGSAEYTASFSVDWADEQTATKVLPVTDHDWKDATFTAPATCSVCGETEGDALVDITGDYTDRESDVNSTLTDIVNSAEVVQPEDHGMEDGANKQIVDDAKAQMAASRYETLLEIILKAVAVGKQELVEKLTYDVTPVLRALDESGEELGRTELNDFEEAITFRLPVDKDTRATKARVWHKEEELAIHDVQTDALGNKYVEVQSTKFSEFSLQLLTECQTHNYENGICTECGAEEPGIASEPIELSAIEAALDAEIQLWLKVFLPDAFINDENAYVVITKHGRWGPVTTEVTTAELKAAGTDARGRYKLIQGIASGEMTCSVDFEFYNGKDEQQRIVTTSGKELGTKATYSILDYVKIIMNGNDARQKKMMVALLTYGGYAQTAFNVDAENPAYNLLADYGYSALSLDGISAETIAQRTIIEGSDIGIKATSMQPFLDSAIYLRLYLKLNEGESISNYTFELTYATVEGTEETMMIYAVPEYDRYYVDITEIPAAYLDYMYKVKITNIQTGESYSVSTSVLVYLRNQMNSISDVDKLNLFKAMYLYNQAANEFFPNAVQ